jgi:hypothetical protein
MAKKKITKTGSSPANYSYKKRNQRATPVSMRKGGQESPKIWVSNKPNGSTPMNETTASPSPVARFLQLDPYATPDRPEQTRNDGKPTKPPQTGRAEAKSAESPTRSGSTANQHGAADDGEVIVEDSSCATKEKEPMFGGNIEEIGKETMFIFGRGSVISQTPPINSATREAEEKEPTEAAVQQQAQNSPTTGTPEQHPSTQARTKLVIDKSAQDEPSVGHAAPPSKVAEAAPVKNATGRDTTTADEDSPPFDQDLSDLERINSTDEAVEAAKRNAQQGFKLVPYRGRGDRSPSQGRGRGNGRGTMVVRQPRNAGTNQTVNPYLLLTIAANKANDNEKSDESDVEMIDARWIQTTKRLNIKGTKRKRRRPLTLSLDGTSMTRGTAPADIFSICLCLPVRTPLE